MSGRVFIQPGIFFPVFSISSEKIDVKIKFEVSALTEQTAEKSIRGRVDYYIDLTIFFSDPCNFWKKIIPLKKSDPEP